jgi:hypothetical protein
LKGEKLTNALRKQGIKVKSYNELVNHNNIEPEHLPAAINYVGGIYRRLFKLLAKKLVFLNTSDSTWQIRVVEYQISEEAIVPSFHLEETTDKGIKFTSAFRAGEQIIAQENIFAVYEYALVTKDCLYPIKNQKSYQAIFFGNTYPVLNIKETGKEAFMKNAVYPLLKNFKVEMPYELDIQNITDIEKPIAKIFLEEEDNFLKIKQQVL